MQKRAESDIYQGDHARNANSVFVVSSLHLNVTANGWRATTEGHHR